MANEVQQRSPLGAEFLVDVLDKRGRKSLAVEGGDDELGFLGGEVQRVGWKVIRRYDPAVGRVDCLDR